MSRLLDDDTRRELAQVLGGLPGPVRLVMFTQEHACGPCREQRQLLEELAETSETVSLEVFDLVADAAEARRYGVDRVPTTAVIGQRDVGVRFVGLTGGYEFGSLIQAIQEVAESRSGLAPQLQDLVDKITEPTRLEVMVTLTCPYCSNMVRLAHQMAIANEQIRADMVDAAEFPDLVQRYEVTGVPRTVINGRPSFEGALPPVLAILEVLKIANPAAYDEIDATMRESRGERKVHRPEPGHRYDVLIVGAGPAALSAAVYAARKARDVALIGDHAGGQVTDTALVENWLGSPEVSGAELAAAFRNHAERHPIAERLSATVTAVETEPGGGFAVHAADGTFYLAATVIYCAGKTYRLLGVPGEDRFLGHGIGFCATCDAPLYQDKRVAIVGGGNSAFTAARDLAAYARDIHLITHRTDWKAESALFDQVTANRHVSLHPATDVREFLGKEHLTGVRLQSTSGQERVDLPVEGVFLEIGLEPNTDPIQALLTLTDHGEIPVERDQSTGVPGLFAAGDATDEPDKQIVVAAAAGAKAALAADRYLTSAGARAATLADTVRRQVPAHTG